MEIFELIAKIITVISKAVDIAGTIVKIVNEGGEEIVKFLEEDKK